MQIITSEKHPIKIWTNDIDSQAIDQLKNVANLPFVFHHVAAMPDVHAGHGSTVGSVIATKGAIIPSAIGVDIGCGMMAVEIKNLSLNDLKNLSNLRADIEKAIPVGFSYYKSYLEESSKWLLNHPNNRVKTLGIDRTLQQLGTLGGGNHFIEVCGDENNKVWLMLHSGSRNIGKQLADYHINRAKGLMKESLITLASIELAFLTQGTKEFSNYIADLLWAQSYAFENRSIMMKILYEVVQKFVGKKLEIGKIVNCHHNYAQIENHYGQDVWITRKGAVSAKAGELGIIPGSMGAKSYIVKGKGNIESFCSCSHGAGRKMSRTKAKARFTKKDLIAQTSGIECRKDKDVIDEIPAAYKNIDEVMKNQQDLVEVLHTLKQVICVKG